MNKIAGMFPSLHHSLADSGFFWIKIGQWTLILCLIASAGMAVWMQLDRWVLDEQAVRFEQAAARLHETNRRVVQDAMKSGVDLSEARIATLSKDVAFAKYLEAQHAFSWTRFLSDLESAVPPRISLASVSVNFKDSAITLNGSALGLSDLTAFANALERHEAFQNVVLSQHRFQAGPQKAAGQDNGRAEPGAAEFSLTVTYKPSF